MKHAGASHAALIPLAFATLSFAIFFAAMAYPWQLAVLASTAIGALIYSALGTWKRMRKLYRRLDENDITIGRGPRTRGD